MTRASAIIISVLALFVFASHGHAQTIQPGGGGGGGTPGGPAGGDLSGTYPNPTVAKVSGTTPGTGVVTAFGINIGSAGAFVINGGALGTPSSGVATNLTGTASGLTAGNVATNANLTGPITSVGNATAVAAQTGTGTTFAMQASPTFTGTVTLPDASTFGTNFAVGGNAILTGPSAAKLQHGAADAASPVAQTTQYQSVVGGTANVAGANATHQTSLSTGTGAGGTYQINTGFASLSENANVTITNASPAVITYTAHGLVPGSSGQFTTTGTLPTGLSLATTYFICSTALAVNTFEVSLTYTGGACGTIINTSSAGSGTHTFTTNTTVQNPASALAVFGPSGLTGSQTISALSLTQNWSTTGNVTGILFNATNIASGASSKLIDLQASGVSQFNVTKAGAVTTTGSVTATGSNLFVYTGNSTAILGTTGQSSSIVGLGLANASGIVWNASGGAQGGTTDTAITRNAAGVVQIGTSAANALGSLMAVNVTLTGNVITGTGDASASSSSGALQVTGGGSVAKRFWLPAITTSAGTQTAVLCQSSGGEVIADSVACLASSEAFKEDIAPSDMGLETVMALRPITYRYRLTGNERFDSAPNQRAVHAGFSAEQAAGVDKRLVAYDAMGHIRTVRPDAVPAALVSAVQALKTDNDRLRARLERLEARR